jgi:hypothetical protein
VDAELWTYRVEIIGESGMPDLTGSQIEARDGSIGKIDEATNETGRACVVVDTGPWIFGRKVMIPAGAIERVDWDGGKVFVNLTKDQIKGSPEFDPDQHRDDSAYRSRSSASTTRAVVGQVQRKHRIGVKRTREERPMGPPPSMWG